MEQSFEDIQFDDIVGKQFIEVERTKLNDIINIIAMFPCFINRQHFDDIGDCFAM